jgi:hypothetical protein
MNKYTRQIRKCRRKGIKTENLSPHITSETNCGMVSREAISSDETGYNLQLKPPISKGEEYNARQT